MFSVIICSIDSARFATVEAMYDRTFAGCDWELIHINDARSLAEGYNRGVAASKGDLLIFSHDDIEILSPDTPQRIQHHLSNFDLIGVAGTTLLECPTWYGAGPPHIFGQVAHPSQGQIKVDIYNVPFPVIRDIQALDGLFMAARRSIFPKISFDAATFDGFHHYDIDFSYSTFRAGFRLAVVNDICIYHASHGNYGDVWKNYAKKFHDKWLSSKPFVAQSRRFLTSGVEATSRAQALEFMTPAYWKQLPQSDSPV